MTHFLKCFLLLLFMGTAQYLSAQKTKTSPIKASASLASYSATKVTYVGAAEATTRIDAKFHQLTGVLKTNLPGTQANTNAQLSSEFFTYVKVFLVSESLNVKDSITKSLHKIKEGGKSKTVLTQMNNEATALLKQ